MATYNPNNTTNAADVLSSSVAAAAAAAATFFVPSTTSTVNTTPLQLEPFGALSGHAQYMNTASTTPVHQHHHQQHTNSSTSSYTFVQIKREPCQVSEISSNNCHQQPQQQQQHQQQHHHHHSHHHQHQQQQHHQHQSASGSLTATGVGTVSSSSVTASATSKTMSSSTLTTLVKIEASSPKVHELDKQPTVGTLATPASSAIASTSNSVPVGIAVARKRPQESSSATLNSATTLPLQQSLNKDMSCFGIRVADLGGVGTGCGNIYFTGNGDLMTSSATAEELALSAAGVQSVNRAPSTFWQYQNALPIESVISMSPATVGLQYSREASRGQVVLLPATPAALGISNFPIYTPTDPFQQAAAAAAFVWPSAYIPQATAATGPAAAAAAAAALQPPPNFIFPSMGTHSTLNATPSYATSLQLYLAAAAGTSTLCQHSATQQANIGGSSSSSTTNSINFSLSNATAASSNSSSSTSSRFLSLTTSAPSVNGNELAILPKQMPAKQMPVAPLLLPPTAMKIEEYNATEYKHTTSLAASHHVLPPPQTTALNFDTRDKTITTTATTNLLDLQTDGCTQQALNLMRLPTPPTSATIESAAGQPTQQVLFQTNSCVGSVAGGAPGTPALLNLTVQTMTPSSTTASIGPPTPAPCDDVVMPVFKSTNPLSVPPHVVGMPTRSTPAIPGAMPPQMQDVNIQTDTPVCSEDENSSCPLAAANPVSQQQLPAAAPPKAPEHFELQAVAQQPLELTKPSEAVVNECHNRVSVCEQQEFQQEATLIPSQYSEPQAPTQQMAEDLTGLELLSNISTSSTPLVRVKQEPVEHSEPMEQSNQAVVQPVQQLVEMLPPVAEPLGGLNLLCALAEQRIQEENVQGSSLFATPSTRTPTPTPVEQEQDKQDEQHIINPSRFSFPPHPQTPPDTRKEANLSKDASSTFPSMEGLELPMTSTNGVSEVTAAPTKRKKHKHSKTSSNAADSRKSAQRCSKKNKRKRKHKNQPTAAAADELDTNDEELQAELRSALSSIDPNYKRIGQWPNPEELFSIMETNMRMRLADITRQYRKKKRKLDEISKHKKKKKCSKLFHQQQQLHHQPQQPQLSLTTSLSALHTGSPLGTSSPLCDYKFPTFSLSSNNCPSTNGLSVGSSHSTYLQPSSFLSFQDKTHAFPPPPSATSKSSINDGNDVVTPHSSSSTSSFVRLEPSSLDAANRSTSTSLIVGLNASSTIAPTRVAHKHPSTEKSAPQSFSSKERKLMSTASSSSSSMSTMLSTCVTTAITATPTQQTIRSSSLSDVLPKPNSRDRELQLASEHLYRKETRVLTDMGGLFYAGVMKPLQPPDVYSVTLDGERGNKSHIMSREEIFKDTILEVAPKSIDCVPVGTRLCAYWSQQYRCLYPGRAIESESFDDGSTVQDFVSVEFDDGDSGRIRLQNIRLLLSDYPIVEYNDNPLYSLGKQKKTAIKSDGNLQEQITLSGDDHSHHSHHGFAISSDNTTSLTATMELFTKRSEKKRLKKSLKKKLQNDDLTNAPKIISQSANGVDGNATGVTGSTTTMVTDCGKESANGRKHHKHKKHKKHKKHHRKAINEAEEVQNYTPAAAHTYVRKQELVEDSHEEIDEDEEDAVMPEEEATTEEVDVPVQKLKTAQRLAVPIKMETAVASVDIVKVKTEQLEMEDESASNMMSEVSDETKADDRVESNNCKGSSKIAAFLPDRQLWSWFGTAYRKAVVKGRARKQFYKTIIRGKETITVGECAVFLSTGRPDRPYIGRIESMWETTAGNRVVRVRWFYHPEETTGCPNLKYPGALFESPHEDENDVQTISHRCEVLEFQLYFNKFGADSKQYQLIYDNNDTYYLAGYYNPRLKILKLQDDIPTLEELQNTTNV